MGPLRRSGDALSRASNPSGDKLRRLLTDGSQHGIHLVLASMALSLLNQVIDKRRDVACFLHRAGLQMSQNDSFELFGNYKASLLNIEGSSLPCALYTNVETNEVVRFKPYAAKPNPRVVAQMAEELKRVFAPQLK